MARISIQNISKTFARDVRAVDGLSLEVADGEFLVLVGPSGSGKSTLLRLVAGLERLSGGAILFDGKRIDDLAPRRRNVSMAFQTPALYPHLSVRQNIAFPLRMRKVAAAAIRDRVVEAAEPLQIATLLDRRPNELSGGERQRVALARTLVRDANCRLMDEPFAHLDGPLREQVRLDLLEIHGRRPTTTLCVTHDQNDALLLGGRVAVMAAGKLQQDGAPLEIYDSPANRFVAGFFGSPPMNFLNGRLQGEGTGIRGQGSQTDEIWFVAGEVRFPLPESMAKRLRGRVGEQVVLGLRPAVIHLIDVDRQAESPDGFLFPCVVRATEVLGDRVFHRLEIGDRQVLIAHGHRQPSRTNQPAHFRIDSERLDFFLPGPFGARL